MRVTGARALHRCTVLAALVGVLAAGCASEASIDLTASGFEATADFVTEAADRTRSDAYRYETDVTTWAIGPSDDESFGVTVSTTGEVDGDTMSSHADMTEAFEGFPGEPATLDGDLTIDSVVADGTAYIRAPFFAALAAQLETEGVSPTDAGPIGVFGQLGDTWGSYDVAAVEGLSVGTLTGPTSSDPISLLDLVASSADQRELGADEVRGVAVEGVGARTTYGDLLAAGGVDPAELEDAPLPPGAIEDPSGGIDGMLEVEVPLEVWIDDEGMVRRFVMSVDLRELMSSLDDLGAIGAPQVRVTMDVFDYGDESIEIDVPTDSVDITDDLVEAMETAPFTPGGDFTTT